MSIPGETRYNVNHRRTFQADDLRNNTGQRYMTGVVFDTIVRRPVASYRWSPEARQVVLLKRLSTDRVSLSMMQGAIKRHYSSGHYVRAAA
jgi:hypothetical protein